MREEGRAKGEGRESKEERKYVSLRQVERRKEETKEWKEEMKGR